MIEHLILKYRTLISRLIYLTFMLTSTQIIADDAVTLDSDMAEKYALYAMMSSNAYMDKQDRTYFPIEDLGWHRVDRNGNLTKQNSYTPTFLGKFFSNLQYDIWEHESDAVSVISFKGTDEKIDWFVANAAIGVSVPYKSAKKHVKKYIKNNPERCVVVTGHSLGGGLALSVSLWEGIDAYVFNSSPRVFDGLKNARAPADRKAIYQENDVLQKIRSIYPKFSKVIPTRDIIKTNFDFSGDSNHRADRLAEGILRCAKNDIILVELAKKIPVSVRCNF